MPTPRLTPRLIALTVSLAALAGCSDRPHQYGQQRPPVDQIDSRDRGLQSKDVVAASDQMAMELLAIPEINASPVQLTMVTTAFENSTRNRGFNYDIFLNRLRVNLSKQGRGRLALIENRDRLANLQSRELDSAPADPFGQGGRPAGGGPGGIQPEYALYGKASDLPNRGTDYYFLEFTVTNLRTRQQVWSGAYEVKVAN